jgi:hypothetical protein
MTKIVNKLDDRQLEEYRENFYKSIEGWELVFQKKSTPTTFSNKTYKIYAKKTSPFNHLP